MPHDLAFGQRAIRRILRDLDKPESLEHDYAVAILKQARRNAAGRPTPQAPMAARVMEVRKSEIFQSGAPDDPAIEVAMGSEFGSRIHPQFHATPDRGGYWLYPATRDPDVIDEADKSLEDILDKAARGMGF